MAKLKGLVLAGGNSSRMGQRKEWITYHGIPQFEHLYKLLRPFCDDVYTSCKSGDTIPLTFNPLYDLEEVETPLNGILTAFSLDSSCAWLSVPVDMPMIDSSCIRYLLENRDQKRIATCFYDSTGFSPEPLLTVWEIKAGNELFTYRKNGGTGAKNFLLDHEINIVPSPNSNYLININSQDDWDRFQKSYMKIG